MILYFPVSALVTLFGNILQNPLDPRARSDTRLMDLVVTFLSMLGQEAETGGVHRMLGVCSEFERIAKVVIEKAEKDNAGRRKKRNHDPSQASKDKGQTSTGASAQSNNSTAPTPRPQTATTSTPTPHQSSKNGTLSPPSRPDALKNQNGYSPMNSSMSQTPSPGMAPNGWSSDFNMNDPTEFTSFADFTGFGQINDPNNHPPIPNMASPPNVTAAFSNPLLPQDLYALPMSFDWDWAEMSGGSYPSVENGNFGRPNNGR